MEFLHNIGGSVEKERRKDFDIYIRDPRPILVLQLQKEVEPLPHPHPDFCTCTYSLQSLAAVHSNETFLSNDPENLRCGAGTANETRKARQL